MSHLQIEFCKVDCTKWFQILIYIFKIYELKFRDLKSFIYMVWESLKVEYEVANTWIERCGVERTLYVILASTFATWLADSNTILQIMFWTEQQILSRFGGTTKLVKRTKKDGHESFGSQRPYHVLHTDNFKRPRYANSTCLAFRFRACETTECAVYLYTWKMIHNAVIRRKENVIQMVRARHDSLLSG